MEEQGTERSQPTQFLHGEGNGRCYTRVARSFPCLVGIIQRCLVLPGWVTCKSFPTVPGRFVLEVTLKLTQFLQALEH